MKNIKVAKRYASALYQFAEESAKVEQVFQDMQTVVLVSNQNREFRQLLASPIVSTEKKLSILEAIFSSKLGELSMKYLLIITSKGRDALLHQIAEQYTELYKKAKGIITLSLKTAFEISDTQKEKILQMLKAATKANEIELREEVNTDLVGGFVLSWDDKQIDATLQRRLRELKKDFEDNNYLKSI